jgi:hypothetical protein
MSTLVEKATEKLQRKIRNISNETLPDLLDVGTGGRAGAGRLNGVINGLDARLCKAVARGNSNIAAAAIVEKYLVPGNVSPAEAVKKVGQPEPLDKSDVEQPVVVRKGEPITDSEGANRARKRAIKAKRKKKQAEASAAEARERLNKGTDMDTMSVIAKAVIAGRPNAFTKRDFFLELQKRADQTRQPAETRERAFARYATSDPNGQVLMRAHKLAGGENYQGEPEEDDNQPVTNEGYRRLMDLANENRKEDETIEQAFARLYTDPKNRDLVATEKRLHQARVAKAFRVG